MVEAFCCPECGKTLNVPAGTMSPTVRCRHCNTEVAPRLTIEQVSSETVEFQERPDGELEATVALPADPTAGRDASQSPPRQDGPGDRPLGRFQIRSQLGSGSFGTVYRAYDPLLEREVALKVPHPSTVGTQQGRERMLREAKTAARLHHAHIVPLYDAGQDGGQYYIASAFIPGQTLEQAYEEQKPDFRRAAALVMDLASALDYAHRQGIIHRDVKPANIMLDAEGEPLLMDFGLACFEQAEVKLTHEGTVMGTPAYMAPEQAAGQTDRVGPAADQYSLGVVLYEMLCGQVPFQGPLATVIANAIAREPDRPRSIDRRIPKDLETICLKSMAKNPRERFADCRQLADDLRRWLDDQPIRARRLGLAERFWRWCRRNPAMAAAVSAVAVLLVTVALVLSGAVFFISQAMAREKAQRRVAETSQQKAEDEEAKAKAAQSRAEREEQIAKRALESERLALASEKQALENEKTQRRRAEAQELRAEAARGRAEMSLYFSRITLAHQKWTDGDVRHAEQLLDYYRTDDGHLRNWEWGCLERMCHADRFTLSGHEGAVHAVALSLDGRWIASAGEDTSVIVWDAQTGKERFALRGHTGFVNHLAFSPDGGRIAAAGEDATVRVWDVSTGDPVRIIRGHTGAATGAAFGPDGRTIVTASADATVKVWDTGIGSLGERIVAGHEQAVQGVAFSPDSRRLASVGEDRRLKICDAATGRVELDVDSGDKIQCVAFDPLGRRVATAGDGRTIDFWDASSGKKVDSLAGHTESVWSIAFSGDGRWIVSGSERGALKLWDLPGRKELRSFEGHQKAIRSVAISPDGRRIASAGEDALVKVWDASTGEKLLTLESHAEAATCVAFHPDGRRLVTADYSAGYSGTIRLWNLADGTELFNLAGHPDIITSLAISSDASRLVSAGYEGTIKLWALTEEEGAWQEVITLAPQAGSVQDVAISPDGGRIAAAFEDKTVRIWEAMMPAESR
jgi:WD40 repeat protein